MNATHGEIGQRLIDLRRARGLSQSHVAREINMPQPTLSVYERGVRGLPLEIALRLCAYFGVTIDELTKPQRKRKVR